MSVSVLKRGSGLSTLVCSIVYSMCFLNPLPFYNKLTLSRIICWILVGLISWELKNEGWIGNTTALATTVFLKVVTDIPYCPSLPFIQNSPQQNKPCPSAALDGLSPRGPSPWLLCPPWVMAAVLINLPLNGKLGGIERLHSGPPNCQTHSSLLLLWGTMWLLPWPRVRYPCQYGFLLCSIAGLLVWGSESNWLAAVG